MTQHQGNSDLNTSESCDIGNANGVKAQVAALNKSGDVGAGLSCAWYDKIKCCGVITACAMACTFYQSECGTCFDDLGAPECRSCL